MRLRGIDVNRSAIYRRTLYEQRTVLRESMVAVVECGREARRVSGLVLVHPVFESGRLVVYGKAVSGVPMVYRRSTHLARNS